MATAHAPIAFPVVVRENDADRAIREFINDPEVRELIKFTREVETIVERERGWNGRKVKRHKRRRW